MNKKKVILIIIVAIIIIAFAIYSALQNQPQEDISKSTLFINYTGDILALPYGSSDINICSHRLSIFVFFVSSDKSDSETISIIFQRESATTLGSGAGTFFLPHTNGNPTEKQITISIRRRDTKRKLVIGFISNIKT